RSTLDTARMTNQKTSATTIVGRRASTYGISGLRLEHWEQNGFANSGVNKEHDQPVNAESDAAHWRGTVLQRAQEVFIELHGLFVAAGSHQGLLGQTFTLDHRVDQFRECCSTFHATNDQVPGLDEVR